MEALQVENDHLSREIAILRETVKVNKEKPSRITLELLKVELTPLPTLSLYAIMNVLF